ncbi:MAG: response regulator [Pirellulales bacterium]|nr:response regulator [Pirellulales bacterium]
MLSKPSVLIVDKSADSREVLKTALQRRGIAILEASGASQGLALARTHKPQVIVLDLEISNGGPQKVCDDFAEDLDDESPTLVVIGNAQIPSRGAGGHSADQVVAKPYHYGPLIRKIEQLVQ